MLIRLLQFSAQRVPIPPLANCIILIRMSFVRLYVQLAANVDSQYESGPAYTASSDLLATVYSFSMYSIFAFFSSDSNFQPFVDEALA